MAVEAKYFYESRNIFDDEKITWAEHAPAMLADASRYRFDSAVIQIYKTSAEGKTFNNIAMYKTVFIKTLDVMPDVFGPRILTNLRCGRCVPTKNLLLNTRCLLIEPT